MWLIKNKIIHRAALFVIIGSVLLRCDKSPLGPQINVPPLPSDVTPISVASSGSTTDSGRTGVVSATSLVCAAQPTRRVFYTGSNIRLNFSCNKSVTDVSATDLPTFLTLTASGQVIAGAGSAPSTPGTFSWSFTPGTQNSNAIKTSVITDVLNAQSLSTSLSPSSSFDSTNNQSTSNGAEFDLGHTVTLDSAWDGAMSDVSLKVSGVTTDLATVTLFSSCSTATGNYICNGTGSNSGSTHDNLLKLKWRWGAFDQGSYTLKVTPQITIEGGITSLPQVQTTFQIPMQTGGKILLSDQGDLKHSNIMDKSFKFSLSTSSLSSPSNPVLGLVYSSYLATTRSYFTRFQIDRTIPPANSAASLTQSGTQLDLTSGAIAVSFGLKAMPQGDWISVGLKATSGTDDVVFNRLADGNGTPSTQTSIELTQYSSTGNFAIDADLTEPFVEGADMKVMVPFVRNIGGQIRLSVAKVNVAGTNRASLLDDIYYGVEATGGYSVCDLESGAANMGRLKAIQALEGNSRYVYVAYRSGVNLRVSKALTQYDGTNPGNPYGIVGPVTVGSGVFNESSLETLDVALGVYSGTSTAGVVYATSGNQCVFSRVDENLVVKSSSQIGVGGANNCFSPTIHYIPQTGRFLVIYSELNGSNKYDIKYVEVTPGAADTFSAPTTVVQDLATPPVKLTSTYYQAGHWIALVYRLSGVDQLRFHGFHVSGF